MNVDYLIKYKKDVFVVNSYGFRENINLSYSLMLTLSGAVVRQGDEIIGFMTRDAASKALMMGKHVVVQDLGVLTVLPSVSTFVILPFEGQILTGNSRRLSNLFRSNSAYRSTRLTDTGLVCKIDVRPENDPESQIDPSEITETILSESIDSSGLDAALQYLKEFVFKKGRVLR